jgi:hypothetical protein
MQPRDAGVALECRNNTLALTAQAQQKRVNSFQNLILKTALCDIGADVRLATKRSSFLPRGSGIPSLYQNGASGDDDYYSILFEDPDRMKIEVVYAPNYSKRECWPNTIVSDFDPYASSFLKL